VNFSLYPIYIPACNAVNFNIGGQDVGITPLPSYISIVSPDALLVEGYFFSIEPSYIDLLSNQVGLEPLVDLINSPSFIDITANSGVLQILPDCISQPSYIPITVNIVEIRAGQSQDLPFGISTGGHNINWKTPVELDEHTGFNWDQAIITDHRVEIPNEDFESLDKTVADTWTVLDYKDNRSVIPFNKFPELLDRLTLSAWNTLIITDKHRDIVYGNMDRLYKPINIPYKSPGANDTFKKVFFTTYAGTKDLFFHFKWNEPGAKDKHHLVPWGPIQYFTFCNRRYYPPTECGTVNFKLETIDQQMIGVCDQVIFSVEGYQSDPRCPFKHYQSGRRDPYIGGIEVKHIYPPGFKEVYKVMNTVLVKRLPDNVPIEIVNVSIKYDIQSYTWQFTLNIPKDTRGGVNYLDLIKPNPSNLNIFTDIEIYINGWQWICRIESWSESRVFAKDTWSVTGRSPSMELGAPLNQKTSYTYDAAGSSLTAGAQIMQDVLDGTMLGIDDTGWNLNLDYYHGVTGEIDEIFTGFDPEDAQQWGIPANTFTWTNLTQIEVLKQLAESIGAFIYTEPNCISGNKNLYLKPITNKPPWHWNGTNKPRVNHAIRTSYASEVSRSYESLPVYTSVLVMGQTSVDPQQSGNSSGIVVADVYRFGPDRIYAPDVTNPWITTVQAATEYGRNVLSDTGEWIKSTLRLFSLEQKGAIAPQISGLIVPGDFIKVEEGSDWYGMVTSTEITAGVTNTAVFAVYQTIEVKQYIGE
jgi:hypothetical protein